MILGRNTVQWLGLAGVVLALVGQFFPGLSEFVQQVLAFATALDAAAIVWITQTSTTPIADPRLAAGTSVTVLNGKGAILGTHTIPAPRA